ncbi:MAG: hypothetical protein HYY20_07125 [Candidatus Tectomicrobia bacterium]|uniref:Uncharacterized protein n=1 Tax=Tectimicrobiota bacterium TaxID=2528274 RepID=A0A932CQ63_UNCTE|nr:hypothetical protein [Candidatus Tectomicrobia bacterium]
MWVGLLLLFGGCSPKKGVLLHFDSFYSPYPQEIEKFRVYLEEGRPDYVIFQSEKYEERWVYLCAGKIYSFQNNSAKGGEEVLQITTQPLNGSKIEAQLSKKDRQRVQDCKAKREAPVGAETQ